RLLFNQRVGDKDYIEVAGTFENDRQAQPALYELNIRNRGVALRGKCFVNSWELGAGVELATERSDSLDLRVRLLRVAPEAAYHLGSSGRLVVSTFLFQVSEAADQPILLQMADGYPRGTHFGGNLKVDIRMADNFDLKLTARGEIRHGEKNRYYLKSELVSRFK
ncbi:MAG: hypothetical protein KAT58_08245, partial [candidate division Zixibacteria bacterium]|nr:hypothetical protein [candidate division Zixibacteria bacterium]